jgi:hypothetical protein
MVHQTMVHVKYLSNDEAIPKALVKMSNMVSKRTKIFIIDMITNNYFIYLKYVLVYSHNRGSRISLYILKNDIFIGYANSADLFMCCLQKQYFRFHILSLWWLACYFENVLHFTLNM